MEDKWEVEPAWKLWCPVCKKNHGQLYICEHYSEEKKKTKRRAIEEFRDNYMRRAKG